MRMRNDEMINSDPLLMRGTAAVRRPARGTDGQTRNLGFLRARAYCKGKAVRIKMVKNIQI